MGQIFDIFPKKIYTAHLDRRITDDELDEVIRLGETDTHGNFGNLIGNNHNILDNEKFSDIKKFIQKNLNEYIEKVVQPKNDVSIYITESWLNYTRTNEYHHMHYHKNSYLSGVFYFNTVKDDKILLIDGQPQYCLEVESKALSDHYYVPVQHGQLILFPSLTYHKVEKNKDNETRVSLAFNTFLKGNISLRNAVGLKL